MACQYGQMRKGQQEGSRQIDTRVESSFARSASMEVVGWDTRPDQEEGEGGRRGRRDLHDGKIIDRRSGEYTTSNIDLVCQYLSSRFPTLPSIRRLQVPISNSHSMKEQGGRAETGYRD
jgi:hypothetical protein